MQNSIQKLRQSTTVFKKTSIFSEKLKTLTIYNYLSIKYFLLKFCTGFALTNIYKTVLKIILFCLDLELFAKMFLKNWFLHTHRNQFFKFLLITQDLDKITKILDTLL